MIESLADSKCIRRSSKETPIFQSLYTNITLARKRKIADPNAELAKLWLQRHQQEGGEMAAVDVDNIGYWHSISCQIIQLKHDMADLFMYQQDLHNLLRWHQDHKPLGM